MAENGNGEKVSYRFLANSLVTLSLLIVGALVGYLLNTAVPRAEVQSLLQASYQTHDRMNARDDVQDVRIAKLEELATSMRTDVAAIRAILERVEKQERAHR